MGKDREVCLNRRNHQRLKESQKMRFFFYKIRKTFSKPLTCDNIYVILCIGGREIHLKNKKRNGAMRMKTMRKQFLKLLSIHGVSGDEGNVRKYLVPCLTSTMDSVEIDGYGNLLAEKKYGTGEGATILLSAHMDT